MRDVLDEGRARAGRRGLRLLDRRPDRSGAGHRDQGSRVGAAEGDLRDGGRDEEPEPGGREAFVKEVLSKAGQAKLAVLRLPAARRAEAEDRDEAAGAPQEEEALRPRSPIMRRLAAAAASSPRARHARVPVSADRRDLRPRLARDALHQFSNPIVGDALLVTLKTSLRRAGARCCSSGRRPPTSSRRRRFPGRACSSRSSSCRFVLPPAVAGIGLLVAFGRLGLLGGTFSWLGIDVAFNTTAVVFAVMLVASPLYVRAGDRGVRGGRPPTSCSPRARSVPGRCARSSVSRCRSRAAGSRQARRSASRAGWASSARRSCSPAASPASRRP